MSEAAPMTTLERLDHYTSQLGRRPLTSRQARRLAKKDRQAGKATYLGESPA